MDDLPSGYRPNVGVCLINSDNLVFVASRLNVPGAWQMPQGGIEEGEEPTSAAVRELREETGVVSAEIIAEVPKWLTYDFPPAVKAKVNRLWGGGEWHGQAQKWFLMRLTKDESEINLASGEVDPEFSEWKWASPEEVVEQVSLIDSICLFSASGGLQKADIRGGYKNVHASVERRWKSSSEMQVDQMVMHEEHVCQVSFGIPNYYRYYY
ncbi:NUDIX hydrolase [Cynara cardunculus var. scolymus]|uniref:NUDIX hydrolase n=1 Tax=Cynara cardunculus var. scolymus TaxID=59895 RepID=A0A103XVI2_CYNCS|nr:NUDIX hydrolase [Cynara cardunculus var. scolymus]